MSVLGRLERKPVSEKSGNRRHPGRDIGVHHFDSRTVGDADRHHQLNPIGDLCEIGWLQAGERPQRRGRLLQVLHAIIFREPFDS